MCHMLAMVSVEESACVRLHMLNRTLPYAIRNDNLFWFMDSSETRSHFFPISYYSAFLRHFVVSTISKLFPLL